ncbi:putative SET domain containing protein [Trypanosoma cruzi]|nr:putative SET domain containing protein [Trypanosoma cruzi]
MAKLVEVREMGEECGVGTFTLQSFCTGDVLLEEAPVVFAQSYVSQRGPAGVRCCKGCGMIVATLSEECERLSCLARTIMQREFPVEGGTVSRHVNGDGDDGGVGASQEECEETQIPMVICSPHALHETLKEFAASNLFCHKVSMNDSDDHRNNGEESLLPGTGSMSGVRFCSDGCKERYMHELGGRFLSVLPTAGAEATLTSAAKAIRTTSTTHNLQRPSANTIMCFAVTLDAATMEQTWPSKAHVLATLEYLVENFNERLLLILSLLARCLHDTLYGAFISSEELQGRFAEKVHDFVLRFAEGAARPLTEQQRAFLRFSWKCVCRWLDLCCQEETGAKAGPEPFLWLTLQLYLRCFWLLDANAHMFVVVSPLYSLLCLHVPTPQAVYQRGGENGELSRAPLGRQMDVLRELFRFVEPDAAHATGVALYDAATKINHSCVPSVRFVPTHGRVSAVVVALRDIEKGEEIRSSYIDLVAYTSRVERRGYLLSHYGFECDCSLCCQK